MNHTKEKIMQAVFFLTACISILSVLLICIFLFMNGFPAIQQIGLGNFLTGTTWRPANNLFGILPMIVGSLYVTAGALV
ncbi:phosphate ABC transporter permease subunit PstC, partial [Streptococcus pyogenes]